MKKKIFSLLAILMIIFTAFAVTVQAEPVWWNSNWDYRMKLTFNNEVQTENLTNFPVMVKLNTDNFDYSKCNNDGSDIRFIDNNGFDELNYEIELWNNTENSTIWVNVTQINAESDTDFMYIYYGNSNAVDNQNPERVWNDGYAGVWHMGEEGTNDRLDSTLNNNDGDTFDFEGDEQVDGLFGYATEFNDAVAPAYLNNGEYINVTFDESFNTTEYTISAWYNKQLPSTGGWRSIAGKGDIRNFWSDFGLFTYRDDDTMYSIRQNETEAWKGVWSGHNGVVENGTWVYAVARYNGTSQTLTYANQTSDVLWKYLNNTFNGTIQRDTPFRIGTIDCVSDCFAGQIDEVRLSTVPRSNNWIEAQYLSMNNEFITFGDEVVNPFSIMQSAIMILFIVFFIILIHKWLKKEFKNGVKK